MIKSAIKRLLNAAGVYFKWYKNIPHGIDWMLDIDRIAKPGWRAGVVFDVGANVGQTARELAAHWPAAEIYSFEPVSSTFKTLSRNVASIPRVHPHHCGLGDKECTIQIKVLPNNVTNSLKTDRMSHVADAVPEDVTVSTVDAFAAKHGIRQIDVLKSDTEGFDVEVFRGASGMMKAGAVSFVLVEVTFLTFERQTDFNKVHALLSEHGFVLAGFYETKTLIPTATDSFCNALYAHRSALRPPRSGKMA